MRVHIEDDIFIQGDRLSFTVDRINSCLVKNSKTGEMEPGESVKNFGNFATLSGAINGVLRLKVSESNAATLHELVEENKKWREELTALVQI